MAYYDNDGNNYINPADNIDNEHFEDIGMYCDTNNDGSIDGCELFECV